MTTNLTKQGQALPSFTNWQLTQSYLQGDVAINNNNLYLANGAIPINTPFAEGTTGATWTLAVRGFTNTKTLQISAAPGNGFSRVHAYGNKIFRAGSNGWGWIGAYGQPSVVNGSTEFLVDGTPPDSWVKIQDTSSAFYGLGSDGALYVAGYNSTGQLGIGNVTNTETNTCFFITKNTHPSLYGPGITVVDFWAGYNNYQQMVGAVGCCWVQVNDNGILKLYSFGMNSYGSIGNGNGAIENDTDAWQMTPYEHLNFQDVPVRTVTTYGYRSSSTSATAMTMLVTMSGQLWSCGENSWGQFGFGYQLAATPVLKQAMTNATTYLSNVIDVQIAVQSTPTVCAFALLADGSVWSCGKNTGGRLGNGNTTDSYYFIPVMKSASVPLTNVKKIAVINTGVLALTNEGEMYATGTNWDGHWGNGQSNAATAAGNYAQMIQANIKNFWAAGTATGYAMAFYLDNSNKLWAAGSNGFYQTGTVGTAGAQTGGGTYILNLAKVGLPDGEYPIAMKYNGGYYNGTMTGAGMLMVSNTNKLYCWGYLNMDVSGVKNLTGTRFPHLINDFYDPYEL